MKCKMTVKGTKYDDSFLVIAVCFLILSFLFFFIGTRVLLDLNGPTQIFFYLLCFGSSIFFGVEAFKTHQDWQTGETYNIEQIVECELIRPTPEERQQDF